MTDSFKAPRSTIIKTINFVRLIQTETYTAYHKGSVREYLHTLTHLRSPGMSILISV